MKYVATILSDTDSYSTSFESIIDAEEWLDEQNRNKELTTIIDEYDDKWNKVGSFYYTEAKK